MVTQPTPCLYTKWFGDQPVHCLVNVDDLLMCEMPHLFGSFPAGISELRWAPASKAESMHGANQRGKSLLWPSDARAPQRAKKTSAEMAPNLNQQRRWPGGDAKGALGTAGAMGRAELMTGFIASHSTCALGQLLSCARAGGRNRSTF